MEINKSDKIIEDQKKIMRTSLDEEERFKQQEWNGGYLNLDQYVKRSKTTSIGLDNLWPTY